jgi:ribosomal protein S18 acetylase RimI-like enzyme
MSTAKADKRPSPKPRPKTIDMVSVRRLHRRDLNKAWEFLKLVFRGVNRNTVEYQRPRTKARFMEVYETEGVEQLLFEIGSNPDGKVVVGYAECSYTTGGSDNWMNPRYFDKRGMRPLYVDELAVHPDYQGYGVGGFMLEQLQHIARVHGCTHLVLEVAQNNKNALSWYHKRNFFRLDAAIFLAQKIPVEPELLPARPIRTKNHPGNGASRAAGVAPPASAAPRPAAKARRARAPA